LKIYRGWLWNWEGEREEGKKKTVTGEKPDIFLPHTAREWRRRHENNKKTIRPPLLKPIVLSLQGQNNHFTDLIRNVNESIATVKILPLVVSFNIP
jgi:hypothetical protein